jgi:hypothetical protein
LFGALNGVTQHNKNTIHGGIYWLPIGRPKHNNQPKTGGQDGGEHGGDMQRARGVGGVQFHHFGGIVSWIGGKNIEKLLSLVVDFFSQPVSLIK